jgi:tRNA-dihydrouridine synthase 1
VEKTIEYAKMIESAGAQLLTVHGRKREQKGHHTGLADWSKIKAVKEVVNIPVIANGNILYHSNLEDCLKETGADGVMVAEGHLFNPTILHSDLPPLTWEIAEEYLDICKELIPVTRPVVIKSHLFKIFQSSFAVHTDLRDRMGVSSTLEQMIRITQELKERIEKERQGVQEKVIVNENKIRVYPPWRCQVYMNKSCNYTL